jgi:hypothetical protein
MIYTISYDLKKPGQDYSDLIKAIKALGTSWAHPCDSYWLVETSMGSKAIFERLRHHIDTNDSILISRFDENDRAGWISKEIWDWLAKRKDTASALYR